MRVDPDGMVDDDIYYDEKGKEIYRVKNSNPDRNFVIKTTQTAEQIYSETPEYMAKVNPITKEQRNITVAELKKGNTTGSHMDNFVEIPNKTRGRNALMAIPDNGRGGSSVENNREYSWNFGSHDEVVDFKSGPVIDWESDKYANVDFNRHHSHFSGTKGLYFLQQAPSKDDISFAQQGNYFVWGMRNGTVYVYNSAGIIATFPMSIYKK